MSFQDRMEAGRQAALDYRNEGRGGTHNVYTTTTAMYRAQGGDPVGLDRLELELHLYRSHVQKCCIAAVEFALFGHEWEGL